VDEDRSTVLVADRDLAERRTLAAEGLAPTPAFLFADSYADAIDLLARVRIDAAIIDFADPAFEGARLLDDIRDDPGRADTAVIVLIAPEQLDGAGELMAAGADYFLVKPLEPVLASARLAAGLRQRKARADIRRRVEHFEVLNEVGIALSAENNTDRLLERILLHAKDIADADGGTLYLMTDDGRLAFEIMRTDSLGFALGGTTGVQVPFAPLPLSDAATGEPNHRNIATHVALTGASVNIADAYEAEGFDFSGTRAFDAKTGYRSRSFLTIPMKNSEEEVIGVLQLLNARDRRQGGIGTFSAEIQEVIEALASQAAVAIDNQLLLQGQRELLDSFIKLIAAAIDAKSPYTGGHCARVPVLTEMLADAACRSEAAPFRGFSLDEEQRRELMTAAWLHDCGKVTTPEHVVDKATKLQTIFDRIELVRTRAEIVKRDARIAFLEAAAEPGADRARLAARLAATIAGIDDDVAFAESVNVGSEYLSDQAIERIHRVAGYVWCDRDGNRRPLLDDNEIYNLSVRRGTLTHEEREIINHHIVMTIEMLEKLPFPKNMRNVPEYAGGHHERMDGTGYPRGLKRDEMSIPARIMAIADVFEALTAGDRPYKDAMRLSVAMEIMGEMKLEQHIDPDLFDLFVESGVYRDYAEQFLKPEQIDEVDVRRFLGPLPAAAPERLPSTEREKPARRGRPGPAAFRREARPPMSG